MAKSQLISDVVNLAVAKKEKLQESEQHGDSQQGEQPPIIVFGYMRKKGNLRLISSWKSYWFILKDTLIEYYGTKAECDSRHLCKGSIALEFPCNIRPETASKGAHQIETKNETITLGAETLAEHVLWKLAILRAMKESQITRMAAYGQSADLALRAQVNLDKRRRKGEQKRPNFFKRMYNKIMRHD